MVKSATGLRPWADFFTGLHLFICKMGTIKNIQDGRWRKGVIEQSADSQEALIQPETLPPHLSFLRRPCLAPEHSRAAGK